MPPWPQLVSGIAAVAWNRSRAGWAPCHLVLTYSLPQPVLSTQRLATSQMRSRGSGGSGARQGSEGGEWSRRSPGFQQDTPVIPSVHVTWVAVPSPVAI